VVPSALPSPGVERAPRTGFPNPQCAHAQQGRGGYQPEGCGHQSRVRFDPLGHGAQQLLMVSNQSCRPGPSARSIGCPMPAILGDDSESLERSFSSPEAALQPLRRHARDGHDGVANAESRATRQRHRAFRQPEDPHNAPCFPDRASRNAMGRYPHPVRRQVAHRGASRGPARSPKPYVPHRRRAIACMARAAAAETNAMERAPRKQQSAA